VFGGVEVQQSACVPAAGARSMKEIIMKTTFFATLGDRIALIGALFLMISPATSAIAQTT